jgi:hypothetical protein
MMDDDECGAVGGMIGRRNRNIRRITAQYRFVHNKSHMT